MSAGQVHDRLNELLAEAGFGPLGQETAEKFDEYLSLFIRWNARLNLSAVRDPESVLSRHFVESIACARALPPGISTLLDFGSGAGLPGIPIALCRPEIAVTLAESQGKKAAFLQEALRTLRVSADVHGGRAESLKTTFDCVTLRAVDRMAEAVKSATRLLVPSGWLAVMTTSGELAGVQAAAGTEFSWPRPIPLPGSESRILALGTRAVNSPA